MLQCCEKLETINFMYVVM